MEKTVILGVSLNTRILGLAVGKEDQLLYFQLQFFQETYSRKKSKKIWRSIDQWILRYNVTAISLKLPPPSSRSDGLNHILSFIVEKATEIGISVQFFELSDIYSYFLKNKGFSKHNLAERLSEKFPELKREYFKLSQNDYFFKIFEAVAVVQLAQY